MKMEKYYMNRLRDLENLEECGLDATCSRVIVDSWKEAP